MRIACAHKASARNIDRTSSGVDARADTVEVNTLIDRRAERISSRTDGPAGAAHERDSAAGSVDRSASLYVDAAARQAVAI